MLSIQKKAQHFQNFHCSCTTISSGLSQHYDHVIQHSENSLHIPWQSVIHWKWCLHIRYAVVTHRQRFIWNISNRKMLKQTNDMFILDYKVPYARDNSRNSTVPDATQYGMAHYQPHALWPRTSYHAVSKTTQNTTQSNMRIYNAQVVNNHRAALAHVWHSHVHYK